MKKGEIWIIDIPETVGYRQYGMRPVIIIAQPIKDLIIFVPLTSNKRALRFPYSLLINPSKINGLGVSSVAMIFQLGVIDYNYVKKKIGFLGNKGTKDIDVLIKKMLKI
jgi:mRNA-degrading endonuclease toxin of MazEF toxin-antitoxin module